MVCELKVKKCFFEVSHQEGHFPDYPPEGPEQEEDEEGAEGEDEGVGGVCFLGGEGGGVGEVEVHEEGLEGDGGQ